MNQRSWILWVGLVCIAVLGGCSSDEPGSSSSKDSGAASRQSSGSPTLRQPTGPPPVSETVEIRLIEPGSEPRTSLVYDFQNGQKETMVMDLVLSRETEKDGKPFGEPIVLPTTRVLFTVRVIEKSPAARYRMGVHIDDFEVLDRPGIDPGLVEQTRRAYEGLPGISGVVTVDEHGKSEAVELNVPGQSSPQIRQMVDSIKQSLRQILIVFPVEPIGNGGRWVVISSGTFQNMSFNQMTTFTLHENRSGELRLSVGVEMSTGRQELAPRVDLVSLDAKGTGSYDFNLTQIVPTSEMRISWTMDIDEQGAGRQKAIVTTEMTTRRR